MAESGGDTRDARVRLVTIADASVRKLALTLPRLAKDAATLVAIYTSGSAVVTEKTPRGDMVVVASEDAKRLADALATRMHTLHLSQRRLSQDAEVGPMIIRSIQRAEDTRYRPQTLAALSIALGWGPDGIIQILDGADPEQVAVEQEAREVMPAPAELLERIEAGFAEVAGVRDDLREVIGLLREFVEQGREDR